MNTDANQQSDDVPLSQSEKKSCGNGSGVLEQPNELDLDFSCSDWLRMDIMLSQYEQEWCKDNNRFLEQLNNLSVLSIVNQQDLSYLLPIIIFSKKPKVFWSQRSIREKLFEVLQNNHVDTMFEPFLRWGNQIQCSVNPDIKIDDQLRVNFTTLICKMHIKNAIKKLVVVEKYIQMAGDLGTAEGFGATRLAVKNILSTRYRKVIQKLSQLYMPNSIPRQPDLPLCVWYIQTAGDLGTIEGIKATRVTVKNILSTQCCKVIYTLSQLYMPNPTPGEPHLPLYVWYIQTAGDLGTAKGVSTTRLAVKDILVTQCGKFIQTLSQLYMPNPTPGEPHLPLYVWYIQTAGDLGTASGFSTIRLAVKDILSTRYRTVIQTLSQMYMPNPILGQPHLSLYSWYIQTAGDLGTSEGIKAIRFAVKDILLARCCKVIQTLSQLYMPNPIPEEPHLPLYVWYIQTAGDLGTAEGCDATRLAVKDILSTQYSKIIQTLNQCHMLSSTPEQPDLPLYSWYIQTFRAQIDKNKAAIYLLKSNITTQQKKILLQTVSESIFNHCEKIILSSTWPKSHYALRNELSKIKHARSICYTSERSRSKYNINTRKKAKLSPPSLNLSTALSSYKLTYLPASGILSQVDHTASALLPRSTSDARNNANSSPAPSCS